MIIPKHWFFIIFAGLMPLLGKSQLNESHRFITLLVGQTYHDTLHSSNPITKNNNLVGPGIQVNVGSISNKKVPIEIIPNNSFTGKTFFSLQYTEGFKPYYITYTIEYKSSLVSAEDDFVVLATSETIPVFPLLNDYTTSGSLLLAGISNVSGGIASYSNDTIYFTPDSLVNKAFLLYSIKDSLGATSNGLIHFLRENTIDSDTLYLDLSVSDTKKQYIYLPAAGYSLQSTPTRGTLEIKSPLCYQYIPQLDASGTDVLYFDNSNDKVVCVKINVVKIPKNRSSVRDDYFYTLKNTPITFNVLANDLSASFPINQFSSSLVPTPGVTGEFTYTPPAGFQGVRNFTYRVNYGNWNYTGKVIIGVGNYEPQRDLNYQFNTLKNTPLLITYNVPVSGYDFSLLDAPNYGQINIRYDDFVSNCADTFEMNKVYIEFNPDNAFYGKDSFSLLYSLTNGDSYTYKIYVDVINPDEDVACPCVTPDCVRLGDLNSDGRVSVSDIIPLARYMGYAGKEREDHAHSNEVGTFADDWGIAQPSGADIKHIDATGDGLIALNDTMAVALNYGDIHTLVPREVLSVKDFPFSLKTDQSEYEPGDIIMIDFAMGTAQKPAANVFGIAFGLNIEPGVLDSSSVNVIFEPDSWFNYASPTLNFWRQPRSGAIEIAHAITNGIVVDEVEGFIPKGSGGHGKLGNILGIVVDEVEGFKDGNLQSSFRIKTIATDGIEIEDIYGERFMLPDTFIQVKIVTKGTEPVPTAEKLLVFPNPANDLIHMHFNGRNLIHGYSLYNSNGRVVLGRQNVLSQSVSIETHLLEPGLYVLQVQSQQGTITKKVIIH